MRGVAPDGAPASFGTLRNNIGRTVRNAAGADQAHNSWTLPLTVRDSDFDSVAAEGWDAPRQADGSLPVLPYYRPRAGSALAGLGLGALAPAAQAKK